MDDNELDHISYLNWHVRVRNCAGMSPGNFAGTFTGTYIYTGRTILVFILLSCRELQFESCCSCERSVSASAKERLCVNIDISCTT